MSISFINSMSQGDNGDRDGCPGQPSSTRLICFLLLSHFSIEIRSYLLSLHLMELLRIRTLVPISVLHCSFLSAVTGFSRAVQLRHKNGRQASPIICMRNP
jgi:hypothetical protein